MGRCSGTGVGHRSHEEESGAGQDCFDLAWTLAAFPLTAEAEGERRLDTERERSAAVLAAAGVSAFELCLPERRMVVDDRFLTVLGLSRNRLTDPAVSYAELVHPDDRQRIAAALRRHAAEETRTIDVEVRMRHLAGHYVWVMIRGGIVERDRAGRPRRICGAQMDVSARYSAWEEHERLEAQLRQAQKFESLGVLAGGIAHDFNNLLCGILGNVDLAVLDLDRDHPVQQSLEEIRSAAHQATELCRQMLAYTGRERLEATNVDVSEIAQRMKQLLGVSISKKISLRFELAGALPPVRADTSQLRQVLLNLVLNASEASGNEPGVISVRTGIEHCSLDSFESTYFQENLQEGAYVFIEVTDSGSGMDAETKARLFDPFYTTKFLGRGLGLAAVLGIVRAHSGAIRVYSELGRGSTLKVLLPALDLGAVPTVSPTSRRRMGGGLVLLADDEPSVRSVGQRMLERLGYRVLIAEDGQQAVALLERHGASVVLVLLDMAMPHLDGVEAFREMRRLRPDIRVVLTSGYSESEATSRFAGKGLAGFLQKPFRLDALRTVMQAAVADTSGESAR